jgi:hypothetical protein
MTKRHLSLTVENKIYQEIKETNSEKNISALVNQLLKEHLKRQKKAQLIADYQSTAQSKDMKLEDKI